MGMFDRYDNLSSDYIPDNTTTYLDKEFLTIDSQIPRPMYDINNNFIGYSWDKGELFEFEVSVDDMITVRKNSLLFNNTGEAPDSYTVAETIGQQAYNTVDAKSWTFVGKTDNLYNWIEDDELLYPVNGDKSIIIHTDMTNKYIELSIFNFRQELVYSQQGVLNESSLMLKVDEELSKILNSGIYNVEVKICSDEMDFIKSRYLFSIN